LDYLGYSKLANILFTTELQRRLKTSTSGGKDILCIAVNPGGVLSPGFRQFLRNIPILGTFFSFIAPWFFTAPSASGANSMWAAASKEPKVQSELYEGSFVQPVGKIMKLDETSGNERLAKELWETTESILKEIGV
jgi:hypothetical protein